MLSRSPGDDQDARDLIANLVLLYSSEWNAHLARHATGGDVDRSPNNRQAITPERPSPETIQGLALIAAYEAALAVASEVRLEPVLQRLVDLSRSVVPAKYAALGVSNDDGRIEQLFVSGLNAEEVERIGPIPEGHGLLGKLIENECALLVPDITHHPDAVGFPAYHPDMTTLVGVPIRFNDMVLGNLYLADRENGEAFCNEDVAALRVLADHAASAIDRAHLYRTVEQEQKRAEEKFSQLRVISDSMPAGVLVLDAPDAGIQMGNITAMRAILGPDAGPDAIPVIHRDFQWLDTDGVELPRSMYPGIRAMRGETVVNRQLTLLCTEGNRRIPVLVQSAPLRDTAEEIAGAVVVFQDVSRMRAAEQIKDDFLSLISHEFRTPLTAIHGGAHLLSQQGDALDDETRKELLEDIVVESSRLDRMLANLLSVSEIMAGRFQASTEPILVEALVQGILDDFARRVPDFSFTLDVSHDAPLAEGDPELLRQILRNLYENAVKYSRHGRTIHTHTTFDGAWIAIHVRDEGDGIAAEHVPFVFGRFRRPGTAPTVRGMGLGLYLSRLLVEAQGGRIRASSPGPGLGATFVVELPVVREWTNRHGGTEPSSYGDP